MALQELPGSFGVMFPAFSMPMKAERSRNKERLEASLAGLCELELLKQRQECRVLSALCLGDSPVPGRPPWGALRSARCALDTLKGNASDDHSRSRLQTNSLQCASWGIKASLEQQVAELKVNTEVQSGDYSTDMEDSLLSSVPGSRSAPDGTGETETEERWLSDPTRRAMIAEALGEIRGADASQEDHQQFQKLETYIFGIIQRKVSPARPSKPRTSLTHDARAVTVVRQGSLCRKEEQQSPKQVSVQEMSTLSQGTEGTAPQVCHNLGQERNLGTGFTEGVQTPYHHQHLQQSVQHQPWLNHRPRQVSMNNASRSTLLDYPSFRVLQGQPDSSNSEPDSPQSPSYPSTTAPSKPHQQPLPEEQQLVNAEYIPAQPCQASSRAYAHHHSNPHKGSAGMAKPNRSTYSPERGHHHHHHHHHHQEQQPIASQIQPQRSRAGPKKCRSSEDRSGATRKPGKKACRSQSENSLQRVPERKYSTVERDGGGSGSGGRGSRGSQSKSKKQQQGSGSYRRWQSSLDLSQDEGEQPSTQAPAAQGPPASNQRDHCGKRTRKSRPTHASYAYPAHPQTHHHQHMEYQLERDQVPLCQPPNGDYPHPGQGGESESSMSEADSPDSSSLSSDSDESGGLVWPQQLPPQLSVPSSSAPSSGAPLQPKAFVKIKASHALKKKILRFRTGSLKVMTTV